jgi:DNA primase
VLKSLAEATAAYHEQLLSPEGERHYEYLNVERGLDHQTITHFRLGAVLDANVSHEQALGMISIPYLTPAGTVQIRFRKAPWSNAGMKYWQTAGSQIRMFNTNLLLDPADTVYVCEGEMDTIAATQAGLPAVGIAGVNGWRKHFYLMLAGFDRVIFLADHDSESDTAEGKEKPEDWPEDKEWKPMTNAGLKFAAKHADAMDGGAVIQMPVGHDVNSYLIEHGAEALRAHVGFRSPA